MITLHRYYKDEKASHDSFVNKWARNGREDWTDEQMEELWNDHVKMIIDIDEIFGLKPYEEGNHTKVYMHDEYGGHVVVKESVDEIKAMIETEEAEMATEVEREKEELLNEIFDFFMDKIGLYDGGISHEESDRKYFIEEFKDKI